MVLLNEQPGSSSSCDSGEGGGKCAHLVTESTTTIIPSWSDDSGSSTIKLTLMVSHGASGIGSGWSSPIG
jgi:hypothetical protein